MIVVVVVLLSVEFVPLKVASIVRRDSVVVVSLSSLIDFCIAPLCCGFLRIPLSVTLLL